MMIKPRHSFVTPSGVVNSAYIQNWGYRYVSPFMIAQSNQDTPCLTPHDCKGVNPTCLEQGDATCRGIYTCLLEIETAPARQPKAQLQLFYNALLCAQVFFGSLGTRHLNTFWARAAAVSEATKLRGSRSCTPPTLRCQATPSHQYFPQPYQQVTLCLHPTLREEWSFLSYVNEALLLSNCQT